VLWLKSRSSEVWLERRTHYTRSCAVMSMVQIPLSYKQKA
jgi:FKBP12-rapamycin complex-associated protein